MIQIDWNDFDSFCQDLKDRILDRESRPVVYGIPSGGSYVASWLRACGIPVTSSIEDANFVVDDLIDSGKTWARVMEKASPGCQFDTLFKKPHSPDVSLGHEIHDWICFPWDFKENGRVATAEDGVTRIIEMVGEDPNREGLIETPQRVVKAFREMTEGYRENPEDYFKVFDEPDADEMVILNGIGFTSVCEHHLLPFWGKAGVGYLPNQGKVIGLSKLARITHTFAKRFQNQERLTNQIARYLWDHPLLNPRGVGVVVRSHHTCMSCRGVRQQGAMMTTSATLGAMRNESSARAEFLSLALRDD